MELLWEKFIAVLLRWDAASILLLFLLIILLVLLLFLFLVLITYLADVSFKFLTGSCLSIENVKLTVKYKTVLVKTFLHKLKNFDKKTEETEIIKRISQTGIVVVNEGSDCGMRDIIILKELEGGIKILPVIIIDFVNSHPSGPFTLVITDDVGGSHWGIPLLARYYYGTNRCRVAKKNAPLNNYRSGIIHEIGHAYESVLDPGEAAKLGCPKEWNLFIEKIGKIEAAPTKYAKENCWSEDFAETFMLYFTDPNSLKEKAPLRYEKMKEIMKNIKR